MPEQLSDLLATLLEGMVQPERCDSTWEASVRELRQAVRHQLALNPGLATLFEDPDWRTEIWTDVLAQVADETGLTLLPDSCPWSIEQILSAASSGEASAKKTRS